MLKPNSKIVYDYVKANEDRNITANDIAEGTGLTSRSVNGIVTSAFQKHMRKNGEEKIAEPLMVRVPTEVELTDGTHKTVKFIKLTEAGKNFVDVPDAE